MVDADAQSGVANGGLATIASPVNSGPADGGDVNQSGTASSVATNNAPATANAAESGQANGGVANLNAPIDGGDAWGGAANVLAEVWGGLGAEGGDASGNANAGDTEMYDLIQNLAQEMGGYGAVGGTADVDIRPEIDVLVQPDIHMPFNQSNIAEVYDAPSVSLDWLSDLDHI